MGIITLEKSNNLFWLGRYAERVYTTLKYYIKGADRMIDCDPKYYEDFCRKIGIPDIYGSLDSFARAYPFDESDTNSVISNLNRAYDNAIILRDYIGTETMAYIQLAIDDIKNAQRSQAPLAELMPVLDHLLSFWGCVNDMIDDEQTRNIIKLGKGVERVDLYLSLNQPVSEVKREYKRMKQFLAKSKMRYDESIFTTFEVLLNSSDVNYEVLKNLIRTLNLQ